MERFDKIIGPAVFQLAQQRRERRLQSSGQNEKHLVVESDQAAPSDLADHSLLLVDKMRKPSCERCQDRGYLRQDLLPGHPQFGKLVECQCRQARKNEARRQLLRKQSKLDDLPAYQEASFETFEYWHAGVLSAYDAATNFAENPERWLVLAGGNGCGKTHLAVAIARQCLENGSTVFFAVVPDLLDQLRAAFAPTAEEPFDQEFAKMREVDILILDDLGSESDTDWATEKLFQLLNYRYNGRLATVITTNQINFEDVAPRLRSRLRDRRLVHTVTIDAQDFREMEE